MTKTTIAMVTMLLPALVAGPALAHPGHGVAGGLHHGEGLAVAAVVAAAWLAVRLTRRPNA